MKTAILLALVLLALGWWLDRTQRRRNREIAMSALWRRQELPRHVKAQRSR